MLLRSLSSNLTSDAASGCFEATMASDVTILVSRGNMHMDDRVLKVADFKFNVKFGLLRPCRTLAQ